MAESADIASWGRTQLLRRVHALGRLALGKDGRWHGPTVGEGPFAGYHAVEPPGPIDEAVRGGEMKSLTENGFRFVTLTRQGEQRIAALGLAEARARAQTCRGLSAWIDLLGDLDERASDSSPAEQG